MKQNLFVRGQGRGYSGLTKMMTIVALLLCMSMGAWADETYPIVYDFEAAANAGETFGNKNGSGGTGQGFYGWESAAKTDWPRQDYKGYTWGDGQTSTNLPQVCHVWRRSDRMDASSGNISNGGLKCPSDKQMAVDGLTEGLTVTIIYDATNASSKEIVWAIGDGSSSLLTQPRATATINGVEAVPGQTTIKSGDVITVNSVTEAQNGSGYIVFKVMKDMVIKKIIIDEAKAAPAGYTVSMKSGVKDADKWTVKVGEGQAQALPIGGLKGDGTETVTLQYNGRLKVKGVKATSDAAPAAPATVDLDASTKAWADGSAFAVPAGGLTYSDAITVSGDVTLTLTEGTTLTLNKGISLAAGATLTVEGNGTMVVNGTSGSTASTVAGSGTLVLMSGTLTATGGNGGSVGQFTDDSHGGNGGDAINGSVIVSGGTLTARGGNGGSVGDYCENCSGGNGGDAISGTLTINGGSTSVNDGSNGSIGNLCGDCTAGTGGKAVTGNVTDNRN